MKAKSIFIFLFALLLSGSLSAQALVANAGVSDTICPGTTANVGGSPTATGGTPPYTYAWTPTTNISNPTIANPIVNPAQPTWYHLTVSDAAGATATDSVFIDLYSIWAFNGGQDTSICIGGSATLGGLWNSFAGGVTYAWTPTSTLDDSTAPRPISTTTVTTTYTVTITSPNCPSKSYSVTVTVNPLPTIDACCFTTIHEGETTILTGTGGMVYAWGPSSSLSNAYVSPTTAEPTTTTQYLLFGEDQNHCVNWDTVTVIVIPDDSVIFYNTFSPNNDGINDFFYIGNAGKYAHSRLEVYTRTGQLVYAKTAYDNSWDGTNYGDKLPEATYYFVFDPGDGKPKRYGSVTIVR